MPSYNAKRFIGSAIESVIAQSYENLEIILVDDGSTDGTTAVVEQYCRRDSRIQLLRQQNEGVASARNRGIQCGRGQYIAPIDSDDIWHPSKIEAQVLALSKGGDSVGLVYSWISLIDEENRVYGLSLHSFEGNVFVDLLYSNFIGTASSPMIPRCIFDEVGGYDTSHRREGGQGSEDWDLYLKIARRHDFSLIPQALVGYRIYQNTMSTDYASMERSWHLVIGQLRKTLPQSFHTLIRWSRSNYLNYLFGKASQQGSNAAALVYLFRSVAKDPARLLSLRFQKSLARTVLACSLGEQWSKALVARGKEILPRTSSQECRRMESLSGANLQVPRPSLFDRIHSRRMKKTRDLWVSYVSEPQMDNFAQRSRE
jgi:glycosyltransferase involved in cell wall biosynthesis